MSKDQRALLTLIDEGPAQNLLHQMVSSIQHLPCTSLIVKTEVLWNYNFLMIFNTHQSQEPGSIDC